MRKFFNRLRKMCFRYKQASQLFKLTRDYNSRWQRWVCRYHLYLVKGDYQPMVALSKPTSRREYIKQVAHLCDEMHEVYYGGFFDSREHYEGCALYIKSLLAFTLHYPLLWFVRFRLRF